jgi:hypothetical protein
MENLPEKIVCHNALHWDKIECNILLLHTFTFVHICEWHVDDEKRRNKHKIGL